MAKIPDKPQDVFVPLTQDYLKVFGRELVSLILYGSAAGGSYIKGKSDINLLLVLTQEGIDKLRMHLLPLNTGKNAVSPYR